MKKILLVLVLISLVLYAYFSGLTSYLSFDQLKDKHTDLINFYEANPAAMLGGYFLVYVLSTALSLPGAAILTLAGGAIFGLGVGTLITSFASTLGASLAFIFTRYLFRESIERRFKKQFDSINAGVKKEGAFYLFTLRLVPVFPFFLINMLMGLTQISVLKFTFVSQIGMLLGTIVYVNAGTQLSKLESLSGIVSPSVLGSFILLGLLPLIAKKFIDMMKAQAVYKKFKKPKTFDYNLIAIGAGSGGLVASYISAAVKARVALIEKDKMGGDCLNTGCVPSKAIIKSAKVAHLIKRSSDFGVNTSSAEVDFSSVMERLQTVIKKIEPHDSVERYQSLGVDCIKGEAEILSPWEIKVNGKILTTKNIVLATGAKPSLPPIPGIESIKALTSENLWELRVQPKRLVVLGGGPIGCEMSQAFARLGSLVTLIEASERILGREDSDVSCEILKHFEQEGIKTLTGHKAVSFKVKNETKILVAQSNQGEVEVEFDEIIVALGRKANTSIPGMERLALEIDKSGTFAHNEYMQTKYPNIFVCGDCAGPYQFTHVASHQAWYAAVNALFSPFKKFKADYRVIPWTTFTDPEVARVGLNEAEAKDQNIAVEVTRYAIDDLDRAIAESEDYGFVKVLTKKGSDKILGVTIVGAHAGDINAEFVLAMKWNIGLNKILSTIHTYPTFSESTKYVAGNWKKNHAPQKVLALLSRFHAWRRS